MTGRKRRRDSGRTVAQVTFHRNGVSGEPWYGVTFFDPASAREVHVAKMREALERAFAAGVDHAARRLTLAVSDAADLGAGNHYALRVIGDAVRSLDEKGGA